MKTSTSGVVLINIALAITFLWGGSLFAQSSGLQIEEIIVTAQKREQNLNDVGVAVTVVSGTSIKDNRLTQMVDLAAQTPNVNINDTFGNSIPNVSIRGLGLNDYAVNNNPAAGIYIDEVYLVSPAMLSFQMFDVERVEILKGPQGTLYGRNTTAGAARFISKKPGEEFEGNASLDYGRYDHIAFEGAVGGQISEGLTARAAVQTNQRSGGHQFNRATGKKVGEIDRTSWRAMLNWQPSDSLDILLNVHGGYDNSDTLLLKVDNLFTNIDDGITDPFSSSAGNKTQMDIESHGVALTINWEISDQLTLTSVTGYEDYSRKHQEDRDGTVLVHLDGLFINDIEQISEELRLTYVNDEFVLIGGIFYGHDEVETRDRFDAIALGFGFDAVGNEYNQEADSIAVFGHSEWQLDEDWKFTAGLRYTEEDKKFMDAFTYLVIGGVEVQAFAPVNNDYDVSNLSGKLGIDYSGIEDTLLYANISRGFKSGNFQGQLTFNPPDLESFDKELVTAYEIGAKTQLLNNSLQFNVSAFFYDYEGVQVYGPIFDGGVIGPLFGITNAGDAELYGAEIEVWWKATEGLDIRLGLGLLDTEITDSFVANIAEGSVLPNSPELNFNSSVRYEWNLASGWVADISFDASYKDDVSYDIVSQPAETLEDGYWLANARAGVTSANGKWGVHVWGKNITDSVYRTQVLTSTVGFGEVYGVPATYGVSFDMNW
jgi:iron complex outermembrane recepter protein